METYSKSISNDDYTSISSESSDDYTSISDDAYTSTSNDVYTPIPDENHASMSISNDDYTSISNVLIPQNQHNAASFKKPQQCHMLGLTVPCDQPQPCGYEILHQLGFRIPIGNSVSLTVNHGIGKMCLSHLVGGFNLPL